MRVIFPRGRPARRGRPRRDAARHDPGRGERGASLVELLVVMVLLGTVGALLTQTFVVSTSATTTARNRGVDAQSLRGVMDVLTKTLRTATDPDGAGPLSAVDAGSGGWDVTLHAHAGVGTVGPTAPPDRVRLWLDGTSLREQVWDGTSASGVPSWPSVTRDRVLLRGVRTDVPSSAPRPLFTYLRRADTDTTTNANGVAVSSIVYASGALTTAADSAPAVQAVEVWLAARGSAAAPVTAVSRVTLLSVPATTGFEGNSSVPANPCALPGTYTVYATADSRVSEDRPSENKSTDSKNQVRSDLTRIRRPYLRMDLSSLPPNCVVTAAQLKVRVDAKETGQLRATPAAAAWTEDGITWNTQPAVTGTAAQVAVPVVDGYLTLDVTTTVGSWMSGQKVNYGWRLSDAAEGTGTGRQYDVYSRENTAGLIPSLTVTVE